MRIEPGMPPRLRFFVLNANGTAKTDLVLADISTAGYQLEVNGLHSAVTSIASLANGVITSVNASGTFCVIDADFGEYSIDGPVGAAPDDGSWNNSRIVVTLTDGTLIVRSVLHEIDVRVDTRNSVEPNNAALDNLDSALQSVLADTDELQQNQGNWLTATGFSTQESIDAIQAVTDQFVFTVANQVDANALSGGSGGDATEAKQNQLIAYFEGIDKLVKWLRK